MTKKRLLSLLLSLLLLLGTAPAAMAAGTASLFCETESDGTAVLSLEDLAVSGIYGVQLELTLAGEYPACTFTPSSRTAYAPPCGVRLSRDTTYLTLYLTDRSPLDQKGFLDLGYLDLGTDAASILWPDTARLTLLDQRLRPASGSSVTIPVDLFSGTSIPDRPQRPQDPNPPNDPQDPQPPATTVVLPFTDVPAGAWYYDAVGYVYGRGMMQGVAASLFAPDASTDRAMIVTILHRLEGSPAALPAVFTDVQGNAYYAAPVAWAASCGVVTGYDDATFRPASPITREQLAAILYRFAQYKGLDVAARGDLSAFPDASAVSLYAAEAMSWAVAVGLINGTDGRLDPGGTASRAQVAVILQRLCVNLLKRP